MGRFILKRLLQTIPVLLLSTVAVFLLLHSFPGDPAVLYAGPDASPEVVESFRRQMGLDRPLPVQYALWLREVLNGNLGESMTSRFPVARLVGLALPATAELAVAAMVIGLGAGLPLGIIAGTRPRSPVDFVVGSFTSLGLAVPNFWLGLLMIILFTLVLGWLPPSGRVAFAQNPVQALKFLAMPAITLGLPIAAVFSRFVRTALMEVMQQDFVRTARSKGVAERRVVLRHALRNALVPVITVVSLQMGRLLGGAVIVETLFAWPGMGRLVLVAVGSRDYMVVQGGLLVFVATFLLINLATDLVYAWVDPRVRLDRKAA